MAGLPPGDPQLVSMIVNHLKTQGLFDQFRRDCLADVDTKPAYLNLKQRVDNFVSNHLSNHTWSPHLNKNQLRNNIRQLVLQSGMLEQGVDRIVAQVVDPKVNHIFRPQVERVVREFLSPGSCSEEPPAPPPLPPPPPPADTSPDNSLPEQASSSAAAPTSDAMSILDTISTLNQEASVRSNVASDKGLKIQMSDDAMQSLEDSEQEMVVVEQGDSQDDQNLPEGEDSVKPAAEAPVLELKTEDSQDPMDIEKDGEIKEVKLEEKEVGIQQQQQQQQGEKEKPASKSSGKLCEEKKEDDPQKSTNQAKQKARERIKEEYSLEDSDLEGLSNISVSSVHTSDLSSFEEESEAEELLSESSEEGELQSDDPSESVGMKQTSGDTGDEDKEQKRRRKAYVHKPFLYSRYYSDSDDEVTVEERRKSAAKDKEERLLKRQQNRERMEEKRKQKAAQTEEQDHKKPKSRDTAELQGPRAKEARKERKVLEKKMALSRRRKLDCKKEGETSSKKKVDSADGAKKTEVTSKHPVTSKPAQPKLVRNLSDSTSSDERLRRMSGNVLEDSSDTKKIPDKPRTHSFILELEQGSQEALKHRSVGKFDRISRKDVHLKERKDKERSVSDERAKHKQRPEKKAEHQTDGPQQRDSGMGKGTMEEKGEKKLKVKTEKKVTGISKEGKVFEAFVEEGGSKESKKGKLLPTENIKAEKDKNREKEKFKEKEKVKGEKSLNKSDSKQLLHFPSLSEDRSDMEVTSDLSKKKDKNSKSLIKRSKSHSEDRPGDKLKSKPEREGEKERLKIDLDKGNKLSSESEKEQRKGKAVEKGKALEKLKSKSKDDVKSSSKIDKVQSPDARGSGSASVSKPEAVKEKKKEDNTKEQKKVLVDYSQDKSENKSLKKKLEKKEKTSEKKDETGEDKKALKEGKAERSEKPCRSSLSPHDVFTDDPLKRKVVLQETTSDSILLSPVVPPPDDTGNDITDTIPEPATEAVESQLYERPEVPAEADALLTLMDVCTSAEARLPENVPQDVVPATALQDADMTMKEAALTLLSMDPDSTVSCNLIIPDAKEEESVESSMDTTESEQPVDVKEELMAIQTEPTAAEEPSVTLNQTEDKHDDGEAEATGESDSSEKETETMTPSLQDESSQTKVIEGTQTPHVPDEKVLTSTEEKVADVDVCDPEVTTADCTLTGELQTPALDSEENMEQDSTEQQPVATTDLKEDDEAEEENEVGAMERNTCEAEGHTMEEESVSEENVTAEPMSDGVPDESQEEEEAATPQINPTSNIPTTESQEEEKDSSLSEKEKEMEANNDQSNPILSAVSESVSGDEPENKTEEETTPVEDPDVGKSILCERRSSRTSEEAEEIVQQPEEADETSSNTERCAEVVASEATAEMETSEEGRTEESAVESPSVKAENKNEQIEEEGSEARTSSLLESGVDLPSPRPEGSEAAESTDPKAPADQRKPSVKRKRSEDSAEHPDQQEESDKCDQEPMEDQLETETASLPSMSQSDGPDEGNAEKKAEDADTEKRQDEQETPVKKPARRGRPPKAAAAENQDKKEQKGDEKETDGNEEEEMGDEEDEKEKATTRATTRAASRLEAERNKPSKPSTRASRQIGKDETAPAARGTRGQAAPAKGGRKRESSPPAVRTRGGQKPEEPPSKRAKR